jgi:hypothetical protein
MKELNLNQNSNSLVMSSLEQLLHEIILRMTASSADINEMNFDNLMKTMQSLTKTVQNFIKIIELTSKNNEGSDEENKFIENLLRNPKSQKLADDLLESLQNT